MCLLGGELLPSYDEALRIDDVIANVRDDAAWADKVLPTLPDEWKEYLTSDEFIDEAMELLEHSGYLVGRNSNRVQTTLFQLLTRVQVDGSELGLLRGMLKAARHQAGIVSPRD